MIPTKTYPLSAIMGEEITDKERIAELEAELTIRREQAEGLQNQWVKDTQKIVALEAEVKMLRKDGARLKGLLELGGYWQDGSQETIKLFQDDACRTYHVQVGKKHYFGGSWEGVIDAALLAQGSAK